MKKAVLLCIFVLLLMCGCSKSEINSEDGLYALTYTTTDYDEYAEKELGLHLVSFYGAEYYEIVKNPLNLGKGIFVFGKEIPTVLYPVWQNDKIIGVFNVNYYNGEYGGSYSEGNSEQLNYAVGKTHPERPLRLLKTENSFYYSIGSDIYSMTGTPGEVVHDISTKIAFFNKFFLNNGKVVNAKDIIEYVPITEMEFLE